jgi:peptidyl-prolyl cis-trans isomerase C
MKLTLSLLLFAAVLAYAQAPPASTTPAPAPPVPAPPARVSLMALPPDAVVATVDGQKVFASDLQTILRSLQGPQQQSAMRDLRGFLEQYGLMQRLSVMAEKAGLDKKSPTKEQMAYNRMLALAQAQLQESQRQVSVKPDEVQKYYDTNKDLFTQARLKVIYISFSPDPTAQPAAPAKKVQSEAEAKAKAEKLFAQLQAGADFVKLVKENSDDSASASKDGDFGTFRRADQQLPEEVKATIFALKQGQVSKPVRQPNGYYIFRVEEIGVEPFDKMKEQITTTLTGSRVNEVITATRKSLDIKIVNEAVFAPAPAPAPPPSLVK